MTRPLAELGYYVFPVVLVDHFFKENGMPTPGEMVQAPLEKIREIIGADAVLYITLKQYGTRISSSAAPLPCGRRPARGHADGDAPLGGHARGAAGFRRIGEYPRRRDRRRVGQVIGHSTDQARDIAGQANAQFAIEGRGLLYGPYSPKYGRE